MGYFFSGGFELNPPAFIRSFADSYNTDTNTWRYPDIHNLAAIMVPIKKGRQTGLPLVNEIVYWPSIVNLVCVLFYHWSFVLYDFFFL